MLCVCVYIYQTLVSSSMRHTVNFQVEITRFEFRVFPLFGRWLIQGYKTHSNLLRTHSLRKKGWIHAFLESISSM